MRMKFYPTCFVVCLLLSVKSFSQLTYSTNAGTLTERPNTPISEMIGGYIEVLPSGYGTDPNKKYPVIIFLEGQSQFGTGDTAELRELYGKGEGLLPDIVKKNQFPQNNSFTVNGETFSFIMIIPQVRYQVRNGRSGPEQMASPTEVNDIVNYVLQKYQADPERVYLSGVSIGGGSTWNYAGASKSYADRLAAIVPFSGASSVNDNHSRVTNIAQSNLPVWTFVVVGDVQFDTLAVQYIDSLKTHPEHTADALLTEFVRAPGDHNSWNVPLLAIDSPRLAGQPRSDTLYQWMLRQRRSGLTAPNFATVTATVDQSVLNLPNGSMVLGEHGISFNGSSVTLNGSVSPSIGQSIEWKKVIGTGGNIINPNSLQTTVTDLKPGFYVFQLRVTDSQGLISVANVNVTVNAPPENKYLKTEGELFSSQGGSADIDRSAIDQGAAYSANYFSPGSFVQYSFAVPVPGTYALYYRYASDCCAPNLSILSNGTLLATKALNVTNTWQTDSIHISLGANADLTFQAEHWQMNYFELALLSAESPLPVKFTYFNTQCAGNSVKIQWSTAQEQNSRNFSVQRSTDGINWNEIGNVNATGQSEQQRSYVLEDKTPVSSGMYRIVEHGLSGQSTISSIIRNSCSLNEAISLYPNPSFGSTALNVSFEQSTSIKIFVIDSKGAIMQQRQVQIPSGNSTIPLNVSSYPKGVYTVSVQFNSQVKTFKLVKS